MIYLLWGLLNIGLLIFFIVICARATRLVREQVGLLAAVIFVFGLLSFVGRSNKSSDDNENRFQFMSEDSLDKSKLYYLNITLERNLVASFNLNIRFGKSNDQQSNIPIGASSHVDGFVGGTNWKPQTIIVNKTLNNQFEYVVVGVEEWRLMGAKVYTQLKTFKGIAVPE